MQTYINIYIYILQHIILLIIIFFVYSLCEGASMAFPPSGSGLFPWFWYLITFPLYFLFISTIVDVRKKDKEDFALVAFIVCLVWMGIFSYIYYRGYEKEIERKCYQIPEPWKEARTRGRKCHTRSFT